jgi:hypothetical protein
MTPVNRKLILFVALAMSVSFGASIPATAASKPCLAMGASVKIGYVSVPTCAKFYTTKSAIRLPSDNANVKFGVIVTGQSGSSAMAALMDRKNKSTSLSGKLVPSVLVGKKEAVQYIFQATIKHGHVTKLTPVLFVPTTTMLKPFFNTQFIGTVNNLIPADGINASEWIRWNFNQLNSDQRLSGQFVNLNQAVRASQMMEPPAPCEPALLSLDSKDGWYSSILGTSSAIAMYWDPAMHTRMDSEYVVVMSSQITYMTSAPSINTLLSSTVHIASAKSWSIHGNPMGTPANFDAGLGMGFTSGFSAQTPVVNCAP